MKKIFRVRHSYTIIGLLIGLMTAAFTECTIGNQPTLSRVYSNRFTPQEQQYNNAGLLGTLNQEYGTDGNFNIGSTFYQGYQTKAIATLPNGNMYAVLDGNTAISNSLVVLYSADGVLQSFNYPTNYVTLAGHIGANCISMDSEGRVLVGGGTASTQAGWLIRIDPANDPLDYLEFDITTSFIGAVGQQTTGRYIAAGQSTPLVDPTVVPAYSQIIGFKNDGTVDATFGNNGQILFDGSISNGQGGFLNSTVGLLNLAIDADNNIYVAYVDAATDTVGQTNLVRFNPNGVVADFRANVLQVTIDSVVYNQILDNQLYINLNASSPQEIIVAGTLTTTDLRIRMASYEADDFSVVGITGASIYKEYASLQITDLIALQNGYFAVVSNDVTNNNIRVNQFVGSPFGADFNFNSQDTPGFLEFQIASHNSLVAGAAVGPDGQLYLASFTDITGAFNPYISKLYDYQYVTQVPQYPLTKLQGNFDVAFGAPANPQGDVRNQEFAGVDFLYNGSFGQALNQQTVGIVELATTRNLLIGSYGLVQDSPENLYQSMMLTWLYPDGTFYNQATLANGSGSDEEMDGFAVAGSGAIYVAGTSQADGSGGAAFLRAYNSSGSQLWVNSPVEATGSWAAGIAIEGSDGILLFVQDPSSELNTGHISRYTTSGVLDTTFGPAIDGGDQTGMILTDSYGLNMGPVWGGGLVRAEDNAIFITYINSVTGYIDVAGIVRDGSGLLSNFGTAGIASNIFGFSGEIDSSALNFAMAFDNQNNVIVGVSDYNEGSFLVTRISSIDGSIDPEFNGGDILALPIEEGSGSLYISNVIGISNGKFMITGTNYSNENPLMIALRVTDLGALDTTFNPAGEVPGILQFQIADEENVNFVDRELTGLVIQSGSANLGNLVCATYESLQYNPNLATPEALRIYGQPRTTQVQRFPTQDQYPGILDTSLNNSGGFNLQNFLEDSHYGVGKVLYAYPAESDYDGMLLVGMDADDSVKIVRFNHSSLTLDPTFGTDGVYVVDTLFGINNIIVDKWQRIVACGTLPIQDSPQAWAFYLDKDGQDAPVLFDMPSLIVAANMIYQQQSGRFIIAGSCLPSSDSDGAIGTLIAFQDRLVTGATKLAVDFTFHIVGGEVPQGQINIGSTPGLYNLVINDDDTMYIAYQDSHNSQGVNLDQYGVSISQVLADGSGFDQNFWYGNVAHKTLLIPDNAQVISCITDTDQNIIVAVSSNNTLQLLRFNSGGTPYPFTPTQGSVPSLVATYTGAGDVLIIPSPLMGTAGVALTDMLGTNSLLDDNINGIILLGTNTANGNLTNYGNLFAVRLVDNGDLDGTWNPYSGYPTTSPNVPGVTTYGQAFVDAETSVPTPALYQWNGIIDIGGNIWTAGASYNGTSTTPTLIKLVGYPYLQEISQTQIAGPSGNQDGTVWNNFPTYGATSLLALEDLVDFNIMSKLYINQTNGSLVIGAVNNAGSVSFTTINAPLNDSSMISCSPANSGTAVMNDLFVANGYAQNGDILSTGSINMVMWAAVNNTVLPTVPNWINGTAIRRAVNGDTLVAGLYDDTEFSYGQVVAFLPNNVQIDPLFGNANPTNGVYTTGSINPVADMAIDNNSRIYITYLDQNSGLIVVQRLFQNGSGIDESFGQVNMGAPYGALFPVAYIDGYGPTQIRMALDQHNNQLVVAALDGGASRGNGITVARFSTIDGSPTGVYQSIQLGSGGQSAILELLDLSINTDQQIYVVAYNNSNRPSGGYQTVVARLNSTSSTTIGLDTGYAAYADAQSVPGIAAVNIGMQTVAGALDPDRRMYVIGNDSEDLGYLARLFGNNYYLSVEQANNGVVLGELDDTYGYDGVTMPFAGGATEGQIASTILPISTGSNILVTVLNVNTDIDSEGTWTMRLLSDGTPDSTYGGGEGVAVGALPGFEFTRNMIFDGVGNAITCGVNIGNFNFPVGFIKNVLPTGEMNPAFGGQNGNPAGTVYFPGQLFTINAVAQLSNGNYVFAATNSSASNGVLGMINSAGNLVSTFGTNGLVTVGMTLSSVSVDLQNNIYVAGGVGTEFDNFSAFVAKYSAAGKPVRSFGNNGNGIASNVLTDLNNLEDIIFVQMVLDAAGNLVVTGSTGTEDNSSIVVTRLTPAGIIDTTFAPTTSNILSIPFVSSLCFSASLVALDNGNYLVAGFEFEDDFLDSVAYIAAITSDGALDTNFNPLGTTPGIGFYNNFVIANPDATDALNISIQSNGQILLAGCDISNDSPYFIPLTMRINGYPNSRAIRQFPPLAIETQNGLNKQFGDSGLCRTGMISDLINGGSNAVDSQGRILIGGITSGSQLVVARFTPMGVLDTTFDTDGINAVMISNLNISGNSYIVLDSDDNVYVAGYTTDISSDNNFVVVRFLAVDGSLDTTFGSSGIAASNTVTNLSYGGYVAVNNQGKVLVGGYTTDFKLVAARFTSSGDVDNSFGTDGVTYSSQITTNDVISLSQGGFVATDTDASVYVGGYTTANTLALVKFDVHGAQESVFGASGVAQTTEISGLLGGGSIALDSNLNIVIGGYTNNKQFVIARFTPLGVLDTAFNGGIAYSSPFSDLSGCASICVDSNNNVLAGGTSVASDGISTSIVIARITALGLIDTTLSSTGTATSGTIYGLSLNAGFISVNQLSNPIAGGFDNLTPQLVIGEFYSGAEIIITNPANLPIASYKIYWYGNNPALFKDFFGIPTYAAQTITDNVVRDAVVLAVLSELDSYAGYVTSGPNQGLILAASTVPLLDGIFNALRVALIIENPGSSDDIIEFFARFNARRLKVHNTMTGESLTA